MAGDISHLLVSWKCIDTGVTWVLLQDIRELRETIPDQVRIFLCRVGTDAQACDTPLALSEASSVTRTPKHGS